jgi:hypothetical protein
MRKLAKHSCSFVLASDVFKGLPRAWNLLCDSSPNFSWGDNNRSLVDADTIRRHLDDLDASASTLEPSAGAEARQVKTAINRLRKLGQGYVDLEN